MNQLKNILWQDEPSFLVVIVSVFLKRYLVYIYIVHTKCKAFIRNHQIRMAVKLFSLQLSLSDMTLKKKILCTPLMKWFHEKWHGFFLCSFFYCLMILVYDDVIKYFFAVPSIFFLNLDLIWWRHFLSFYYHFFLDERKFLMAIWQKIIIVLLCAVNNFTWNDTVTFSILFDDNCHDAIMRELYNSIFRIFESI